MILRRLYLYLVSAAALGVLAVGLVLLGATVVLFVLHDPSANYNRGALAIYSAMTLVALPVWAVHFGFAQRFALRDPYERASALRRLYLYWACLFSSLGATLTIGFGAAQLLLPVLDGQPFNPVPTAQLGWATVVLAAIWASHFMIAGRDRAVTPEEGTSATLRRWYMYIALLVGMLAMLAGTASLLQAAWTDLTLGTVNPLLSGPAGLAIAGVVLWGVHARVIALRHTADDRHSTLRALEGFIAVAISIAVALTGASQILYYLVARALGVENPGDAGTNFVAAAAGPGSQLLVYGIAWFLVSRRLTRDAAARGHPGKRWDTAWRSGPHRARAGVLCWIPIGGSTSATRWMQQKISATPGSRCFRRPAACLNLPSRSSTWRTGKPLTCRTTGLSSFRS